MAVNLMEALGAAEDASQDRVTIYIPSCHQNGEPVDFEVWVERALEFLSRVGGGANRMPPAKGAWLNPLSGAMITEDVALVYSFVDGDALTARIGDLRKFMHAMGGALDQGEVAIEANQNFYKICAFDP